MSRFILTKHAKQRLTERKIRAGEVKKVIQNPLKLEKTSPGILKATSRMSNGNMMTVVYKEKSGKIIIITAY